MEKNFLSNLGFRFALSRTPEMNFFVQSVTLPAIDLGQFDLEDPFVRLPQPGTKLNFNPLNLTFLVNEDMDNYLEIFDWLNGLGFPENFNQYTNFVGNQGAVGPTSTQEFSDGSLLILSSHKNASIKVNFQDMFPISLSDLTFDSTLTDVEYLRATVTFRYRLYTIEKI